MKKIIYIAILTVLGFTNIQAMANETTPTEKQTKGALVKEMVGKFKDLDFNGDGKVQVQEYEEKTNRVDFATKDKNNDGVLSVGEVLGKEIADKINARRDNDADAKDKKAERRVNKVIDKVRGKIDRDRGAGNKNGGDGKGNRGNAKNGGKNGGVNGDNRGGGNKGGGNRGGGKGGKGGRK